MAAGEQEGEEGAVEKEGGEGEAEEGGKEGEEGQLKRADREPEVGEEEQLQAPLYTNLCLGEWREHHLLHHPTLSDMLVPSTSFVLQILDFSLLGGKPTGEVVITDGEFTCTAMLGEEGSSKRKDFSEYLMQRRFGKYSLVKVCQTSGPPHALVIVS